MFRRPNRRPSPPHPPNTAASSQPREYQRASPSLPKGGGCWFCEWPLRPMIRHRVIVEVAVATMVVAFFVGPAGAARASGGIVVMGGRRQASPDQGVV